MTDIDMELKRVIDQRLSQFEPPARRKRARSWRMAVIAAVAAVVIALGGVALDMSTVAAASGVDCPNLIAKVEFWAATKVQGKSPSAQTIKTWVEQGGCAGTAPKPIAPEQPKQGAPTK